MTFDDVKDNVRSLAGVADGSQDDILAACFDAAVKWFENADVPNRDGDPLYMVMVSMLTVWFRVSPGLAGADAQIPQYIVTSVHQLRDCVNGAIGEIGEEDTDGYS